MANLWDAAKDVSAPTKNPRDLLTQSVISIGFGLSAFLTFCALRPKWKVLYAARKRQKNAASKLPDLPNTFFGWMPTVYRITEGQVLASAGLDAFVFLAFFKMAIKFLAVVFFFSLTVIFPIHKHFDKPGDTPTSGNGTAKSTLSVYNRNADDFMDLHARKAPKPPSWPPTTDFLWVYVIFVYLFSGYAIYLIITETTRIIRIRQRYLGTQTSPTDRTIRLSGIPAHLRSERAIKETIESLEIGKVDSVTLCRNWKELDDLMTERMSVLRMLEEAWTVHLGHHRVERSLESLPIVQPSPPEPEDDAEGDSEESALLYGDTGEQPHVAPYARDRPMTRIWFGFLKLQSRRVDAIDYFQEKMRKIDDKIRAARKKDYEPTPLAFVTLDSIPACQMAVQAIIDPEPMQFVANLAPAPADVVWRNTYLPRSNRMIRAWSITFFILVLTVFWSLLLIPVAGLIDKDTIRRVLPGFADFLQEHKMIASLVQTGVPTLLISLLNVLVPYLYDWLSNLQGMTSQGDIEMSLISKNFFFTFFNLFIVFTVFGTASKASGYWEQLGDTLKDTTRIAYVLAESLGNLANFYMNLIILQGLGLFPFRLLEFGSVAMYPISLMGAKTPRDYAELVQPTVFSYGYYLPQTLLIFIICMVYSVLPKSELVTLFGLMYFMIGGFIYKYQLLYAMDHRPHSTGRAWTIICNRVIVGLLVFQLAMTGQLAGRSAIKRAILVIPLLVGTVWFAYFYRRTYEPLMKFIALRSLHHEDQPDGPSLGESRYESETGGGRAVDEDPETGIRFINPSLIIPLEDVWILNKRKNRSNHAINGASEANGEETV